MYHTAIDKVLKWFYIGNNLMKALIAFLALNRDLQSLIFAGAQFQALVASFMKVDIALSEVPSSWKFFLESSELVKCQYNLP